MHPLFLPHSEAVSRCAGVSVTELLSTLERLKEAA